MPSTYTLISSTVLSSSAASVTFSAIPATYTDLTIRASTQSTADTVSDTFRITFNAITSGYSSTSIGTSDSTSVFSARLSAQALSDNALVTAGNTGLNIFGFTEIYIPSYLVSQNKPFSVSGTGENNDVVARSATFAGLLSNTAAITSIKIEPGSTFSFVSGSSFYLYGIKNS
jgi:hypothetical protein